ncbi:MAG: hypothetical protein R2685_15485 [Candidatus Nitrosocosmicus sp.]|nr:hypothetical protein [Candidatus Nitrosocosmicus sp.]
MYNILSERVQKDYIIKSAGDVILELAGNEKYPIYYVEGKNNIFTNPFKYKASSSQE